MKKILIVMSFVVICGNCFSQILTPVKWSYAAKRTGKNEVLLFLKATIEYGWHIYSLNQKLGGPQKTSLKFSPSSDYEIIGSAKEPIPKKNYEKVFEMDVFYFNRSDVFSQKVKLNKRATTVKGTVSFMTCTDRECLPPDEVEFVIPIK